MTEKAYISERWCGVQVHAAKCSVYVLYIFLWIADPKQFSRLAGSIS
jgi:hypothetical protein